MYCANKLNRVQESALAKDFKALELQVGRDVIKEYEDAPDKELYKKRRELKVLMEYKDECQRYEKLEKGVVQ